MNSNELQNNIGDSIELMINDGCVPLHEKISNASNCPSHSDDHHEKQNIHFNELKLDLSNG